MSRMPHPENARLDALIGTWHTQGEILGDDGSTTIASIDGTDSYEWLGRFFVIHRADVRMGDEHIQSLEMIGAYDPDTRTYPTRSFDNQGGIQTSAAAVDDGVWTFGADGAEATLHIADDGQSMRAGWRRSDDGGTSWRPWMHLRFTRTWPIPRCPGACRAGGDGRGRLS